jgi:hypothetical protein
VVNHEKLGERQFIFYKELPLPEETGEQRKKNMQLFCDNLELILANSELVLKTPEYFQIRHEWSLVGGAYVGSKYIPLGVLIKLWQNDQWLGECPECGSKTYIYCAGGSPLSGSHYTNAVCTTCKEFVDQKKSSGLAALIKPAFDYCSTHTQNRKILRTKGPVFSWSKGLVGETVPDKVLEDVVQPVELEVMINNLLK